MGQRGDSVRFVLERVYQRRIGYVETDRHAWMMMMMMMMAVYYESGIDKWKHAVLRII